MKIYFDATPTGLHKYQDHYEKIATVIEQLGHSHTCDFITKFDTSFYNLGRERWGDHYLKIIKAIDRADVMVVEISVSSLGLGQCVQYALMQKKPVIALTTSDRKDIFLTGAGDVESKLMVVEYSLDSVSRKLIDALAYAEEWLESRFTLILDGECRKMLDVVAKSGVSRSDYIRSLIKRDITIKGSKE